MCKHSCMCLINNKRTFKAPENYILSALVTWQRRAPSRIRYKTKLYNSQLISKAARWTLTIHRMHWFYSSFPSKLNLIYTCASYIHCFITFWGLPRQRADCLWSGICKRVQYTCRTDTRPNDTTPRVMAFLSIEYCLHFLIFALWRRLSLRENVLYKKLSFSMSLKQLSFRKSLMDSQMSDCVQKGKPCIFVTINAEAG